MNPISRYRSINPVPENDLRIKRFTPAAIELCNLIAGDIRTGISSPVK